MLSEGEVRELDVLRIGPHADDCNWEGRIWWLKGKGDGNRRYDEVECNNGQQFRHRQLARAQLDHCFSRSRGIVWAVCTWVHVTRELQDVDLYGDLHRP